MGSAYHDLLHLVSYLVSLWRITLTGKDFCPRSSRHDYRTGPRYVYGRHDENIGLFRATVRALLRTFLGWLSFVFILLTKKHQALHDYVTSTIVVLRRPETLPAHEKLGVRTSDEHEILSFPKRDDVEYLYPSKVRRILAILLYGLLITIALCVFALVLISEECSLEDRCSPVENLTMEVVGLGWLISIGTTIVLGWRGLLFCCHRKALPPSAAADS